MDVKAITLKYLQSNHYDGLYSDDCGCKNGDLFPCGNIGVESCKPGYLQTDSTDEFEFKIGPDK